MSYGIPHPIDVMVRVAGRQFPAHHTVLVEHSGYFRDVLNRSKSSIKTKDLEQRLGAAELDLSTASLLITVPPSISSKSFSILLDFMYSSKLHLDYHNAPEILQCAQILDMPKAVDMCRHYILGSQQPRLEYPTLGYTSCLARLWHTFPPFFHMSAPTPPSLLDSQHHQQRIAQPLSTASVEFIQPPHGLLGLESSTVPLTPQLIRPIASRPHHYHPCYHQLLLSSPTPTHTVVNQLTLDKTTVTSQLPTKDFSSATEQPRPPQPTTSSTVTAPISTATLAADETVSSNDSELDDVVTIPQSCRSRSPIAKDPNKSVQKIRNQRTETSSSPPPEKKAILDIAYCDGPVKFQRILNENCDLVMVLQATDRSQKPKSLQDEAQKGASKEIKKGKNTEKQPPSSKRRTECSEGDEAPCSPSETDTSGNFHCVYCRHTFKSRYCYIKHKRRHLNPLTIENSVSQQSHCSAEIANPNCTLVSKDVTANTVEVAVQKNPVVASTSSVTTKPLEINSTFYPCKICGCKFPSYYFVHKHRHTCHPGHNSNTDDEEEAEEEEEEEERKNERVPVDSMEDEELSVCT